MPGRHSVRSLLQMSGLAWGVAILAGCVHAPPIPQGVAGPEAQSLARGMLDAVDAAAWAQTRAIAFEVVGRSDGRYVWDRERGLVRVERADTVAILDLGPGPDRAFDLTSGQEIPATAFGRFLDANRHWEAQMIWLDPWRTWSAGDHRLERIERPDGSALLVVHGPRSARFQPQGGVWEQGPDGLPMSARLWRAEADLAGAAATWEGWITLPTGYKLATRHVVDGRVVELRDVRAGATFAALGFDRDPFSADAIAALGGAPAPNPDDPPPAPPPGPIASGDGAYPPGCAPTPAPPQPVAPALTTGPPLCGKSWTEIAARFTPDVYFHPDEKYFPSSVEWYMQRSWLWRYTVYAEPDGGLEEAGAWLGENVFNQTNVDARTRGKASPTFDDLAGVDAQHYISPQPATGSDPDPAALVGDLEHAPFYVRVNPLEGRTDAFDLQYWFFYPYNGNIMSSAGTSLGLGHHEGDWEHIEVHVRHPGCPDARIEGVIFAAHGEGDEPTTEYGYEGLHPTVLSAKGSHASYSTIGSHTRLVLDIGDDPTGEGKRWHHDARVEVASVHPDVPVVPGTRRDTSPWVYFLGRWGQTVSPKKTFGQQAGASPRTPSYHSKSAWPGPPPVSGAHRSPLRNALSNQCLTVRGAPVADAPVWLDDCAAGALRLGLTPASGELQVEGTALCVDTRPDGLVSLMPCAGAVGPRWWLRGQGDPSGYVMLQTRHAGGCLAGQRPYASPDNRAIVTGCKDDDGVRWALSEPPAGDADGFTARAPLALSDHVTAGGPSPARPVVHRSRHFISLAGVIGVRGGRWGEIARLPEGYRPDGRLVFSARTEGGTVRVDVMPDGRIQVMAPDAAVKGWLSLSGINFSTRSTRPMTLSFLAEPLEGYAPPSADRIGDVVVLTGTARLHADKAVPGQGWPIGNVGVNVRPQAPLTFRANADHSSVEVSVTPDGVVWVAPTTGDLSRGWVSLSGIRYAVRPGAPVPLAPGVKAHGGPVTATRGEDVGVLGGSITATTPGVWGLAGTLPASARPPSLMRFVADAKAYTARVDVHPDGRVCVLSEGADLSHPQQRVSLSGISYPLAR